MEEKLSYIERIINSTKLAVNQLLVKLEEPLDIDLEDKQIKQIISGRIELIISIRKMIIVLNDNNVNTSYIKEKLFDFKAGIEKTFDVLEILLGKEIEEDDATKYNNIAKSKIEANSFMFEILDSIKELELKIQKGDVTLKESTFKTSIEQFAIDD